MGRVETVERLKSQVEKLRTKLTRAETLHEQAMERLQEEFNCSSVEEAETKAKEMDDKVKKLEEDFDDAVNGFRERWGKVLDEVW